MVRQMWTTPQGPVHLPSTIGSFANVERASSRSSHGDALTGELRDDRRLHLLTRGNVDGIVSAAMFLARDPKTKVSFVPSGDLAVDRLRKDISSDRFYLVDLGLTPRLIKTLNQKAKTQQDVTYLDHHQQSALHLDELRDGIEAVVETGRSAAAVAYEHLGLNGRHRHLVAIADLVEYCETERLAIARQEHGVRVDDEARVLDFSWRAQVDDDRFRRTAAHQLSKGLWPTQVAPIKERYLRVVNEGRWDRALAKVRDRIEIRDNVGMLRFGRRKPSLFGFGSRAMTEVARECGVGVAVMLNRRNELSSASLRETGHGSQLDLGAFAEAFALQHGIVGGGHPQSAGAKIPTRSVPQFLKEVVCLA